MQESDNPVISELTKLYHELRYSDMIAICNEEIEANRKTYQVYGARGMAYLKLENLSKAIIDFDKSIKLNPSYALGYYNRSRCFFEMADYAKAITDMQKAHELNPDIEVLDLLGLAYACLHNHKEAIRYFSLYLEKHIHTEVLYLRAESFAKLDEEAKATEDYVSILQIEVNDKALMEQLEKLNYPVSINQGYINATVIPHDEMDAELLKLDFVKNHYKNESGVYIIRFSNDEFYVGQTQKLFTRIRQHRKRFNDISSIYFKPVRIADLIKEENSAIAFLEKNQIRIRNLKQIDFSNIFDATCQRKWVESLTFNYLSGTRYANETLRNRYTERYAQLNQKPYFKSLTEALSNYIKTCIPNYWGAEYNYWALTCLPKHLPKENCASRININAVPVLSAFANQDQSLNYMLFMSKLPLLNFVQEYGNLDYLLREYDSLQLQIIDAFENTQGDELVVHVHESEIHPLIQNEVFLKAIRLFNLRMMNNTGREDRFRRTVHHCVDLADYVLHEDTH